MKKILSILVLLLCVHIFPITAQTVSTEGKEFYAGFLGILPNPPNTLRFVISSRLGAVGTISMPSNPNFNPINFTVAANSTYQTFDISSTYTAGTREQVENKGFYINATNDISVTAINQSPNRTEASLVLPRTALGNITEYVVNTVQKGLNNQGLSEFMLVATDNNTTIEITPSATTTGNKPANMPFTVTLQRGQIVQYQTTDDFTGTRIRGANGSCKSFAVFAGTNAVTLGCANNTLFNGSAQHVYEQLFPIHTWGTQYIVTPYAGLNGVWYRIVARENDTKITVSDGITVNNSTLQAGANKLLSSTQPVCIKADKPISVIQISQNSNCNLPNIADPSFLNLNAVTQSTNKATFNTIELATSGFHFINVVMKTTEITKLRMNNKTTDNNNIPLINYFNKVLPCDEYSFAAIPVVSGNRTTIVTTTLSADAGFSAFAYGYSNVDIYAYAVGASFENLEANFSSNVLREDCQKTEISFAGVGTNVSNYTWDFGDGTALGTGQNPKHIYTNSGTYQVTMNGVLFGGSGCAATASVTKEITVNVAQPITISAKIMESKNPLAICGTTDTLYVETVENAKYQWNLNGIPIPNATKTALAIASSGTYTVSVALGTCSSATSLPRVVKFLNLQAKIKGDTSQKFCQSGVLRADVQDTTLYTYQWRKDGKLLAIKAATLWLTDAEQSGSYTLTLQQDICTAISKPVTVLIIPNPIAQIIQVTPVYACDSTILQAQIVKDASYTWTRNNVIVGTNSPTLSVKTSGNYAVTVKVAICSTISPTVFVRITPTPVAKIIQKSPVYFCTQATISAQKVDSASYIWFRNGNIIPNTSNKSEFVATEGGIYRVLIRVNNCEKLSDTIALSPKSIRAVILQKNSVVYCEKGILQADTLANVGMMQYEWFWNGKSIAKTPSITITESGVYQLKTTQETCEDIATISATVNKFPTDLSLQTSTQNFCIDSLVTLQVQNSNNMPNAKYQWTYNGKNLPNTEPKMMVSLAGIYTVNVQIAENCSKTLRTEIKNFAPILPTFTQTVKNFSIQELVVFPNPTTGILYFQVSKEIGTTLRMENPTAWKNIIWTLDNTALTENNNKTTILATKGGIYRVKGIDTNGCPQISAPITLQTPIIPNFTISLINMLGQTVIENKQTFKIGEVASMDISHLAAGAYWLRVQTAAGEISSKVLKIEQ